VKLSYNNRNEEGSVKEPYTILRKEREWVSRILYNNRDGKG
jgi:hypothetical protein